MNRLPQQVEQMRRDGALFVINHSGGKDSQAMTTLLSHHLPPEQVLVIHAELPVVDWAGIPEHIENTLPAGWPVRYVKAGKTLLDMVERRYATRPDAPSWPSPANRQCTSDLKRDPIAKLVRAHIKANPQFGGKVVHCIGIRAEESARRAKAETWKLNKRESKAGRTVFEWLPIHDLLEPEVYATIAQADQRPHWAYQAGMTRLSCCFCIMASERDLKTAAKLQPALLGRYIELEERTGYTMSMSRRPLTAIVADDHPAEGGQLELPCFSVA